MRLLLTISLTILCFHSFSQEFTPVSNDAAVLKGIQSKSAAIQTLKGNFDQKKTIASLGIEVVSTGEFYFTKSGNKLLWQYLSPGNFGVVFLDGTMKIRNIEGNNLAPKNTDDLFSELNTIVIAALHGNLGNLSGYKKIVTENTNKYNIKLTPESEKLKEILESFSVFFDKKNGSVANLVINEKSGDKTQIDFKSIKLNASIPSAIYNIK